MGKKARQKLQKKKEQARSRAKSKNNQSSDKPVDDQNNIRNNNDKENLSFPAKVSRRRRTSTNNSISTVDVVQEEVITNGFHESDDDIHEPNFELSPPSVVDLNWKKQTSVGPGLQNLGNTCFMNSVLQCLTYCAPLVNYLIYQENSHSKGKCNGFCFACILALHMRECHSSSKTGVIKPFDFAKKLGTIAKNFKLGRQEDAHEYLRHAIDHMCKTTVAAFESKRDDVKLDAASKETTAFNRIFGGYLRSQVTCMECHHESNTFDHFMDFMLEIKNVSSLEEAFERFVKPDVLDNENAYKCEKCKKKCRAVKKFSVHRPPNVATIQLKRFEFHRMHGGKISKHIDFPTTLDLRPYMSNTEGTPVLYSLTSVLVHSGYSCNSGHYFSFVRSPNGTWFRMDDASVSAVSVNNVLYQNAYILFYTRSTKASVDQPTAKPSHVSGAKKLNQRTSVSEDITCNGSSQDIPDGAFSASLVPFEEKFDKNLLIGDETEWPDLLQGLPKASSPDSGLLNGKENGDEAMANTLESVEKNRMTESKKLSPLYTFSQEVFTALSDTLSIIDKNTRDGRADKRNGLGNGVDNESGIQFDNPCGGQLD